MIDLTIARIGRAKTPRWGEMGVPAVLAAGILQPPGDVVVPSIHSVPIDTRRMPPNAAAQDLRSVYQPRLDLQL